MSGQTYQTPLSLGDMGTTSDPVSIGIDPSILDNIDISTLSIATFKDDETLVSVAQGTTIITTQGPPLPAGNYVLAFVVRDPIAGQPLPTVDSLQNNAKINFYGSIDFKVVGPAPVILPPAALQSYNVSFGVPIIFWVSFTITQGSGAVTPSPPPSPISAQSCFRMGTMIETDQGTMKIEDVVEGYNTINNKQINRLTKCLNSDGLIVKLEKGCLGENKPSQDLYMQKDHKLMLSPFEFAGLLSTGKITFSQSSTQEILYNILLDTHETMNVANITVETLNPELAISKYFMNSTVELKEKIEADTIKIPIV